MQPPSLTGVRTRPRRRGARRPGRVRAGCRSTRWSRAQTSVSPRARQMPVPFRRQGRPRRAASVRRAAARPERRVEAGSSAARDPVAKSSCRPTRPTAHPAASPGERRAPRTHRRTQGCRPTTADPSPRTPTRSGAPASASSGARRGRSALPCSGDRGAVGTSPCERRGPALRRAGPTSDRRAASPR